MFTHLACIECLIYHSIVLELSVLLGDVVIAQVSELVGLGLGNQSKSEWVIFSLLWITKRLDLLTKALVEWLLLLVLLRCKTCLIRLIVLEIEMVILIAEISWFSITLISQILILLPLSSHL